MCRSWCYFHLLSPPRPPLLGFFWMILLKRTLALFLSRKSTTITSNMDTPPLSWTPLSIILAKSNNWRSATI
ncbi:hypothetical protein BCR42DRAFT_157918 [Absidia repens]|uniref:Uncharacterized protein n=1 Tax=Absidia repens TaxID=90262 RepID=A0A1X2I0N8_9FUNG|nr:hypothetical protein BCR42DRAFT_157918 [Absidia repens]